MSFQKGVPHVLKAGGKKNMKHWNPVSKTNTFFIAGKGSEAR
jgi:hypothetical protein